MSLAGRPARQPRFHNTSKGYRRTLFVVAPETEALLWW